MKEYINKSAVVAEIEKIREHVKRLRYAVDANCIVTIRNACECLDSSIDLLVNSIGTLEVKEVDLENSMVCKVNWCDGFLLDYTQEQQDELLEKIGANVGDKIRVILIKE